MRHYGKKKAPLREETPTPEDRAWAQEQLEEVEEPAAGPVLTEYEVIGVSANVPAGAIVRFVTDDQIRRRRHLVGESIAPLTYRLVRGAHFKRGERFASDGDVSKAALKDLRPTER